MGGGETNKTSSARNRCFEQRKTHEISTILKATIAHKQSFVWFYVLFPLNPEAMSLNEILLCFCTKA